MKEAKRARKNSGGRYEGGNIGEYGKGGVTTSVTIGNSAVGLSKFLPVESGGGGGGVGGVTLGIINAGSAAGNMAAAAAKFLAANANAMPDIAEQSNSLLSLSGAFSQDSNLSSGGCAVGLKVPVPLPLLNC